VVSQALGPNSGVVAPALTRVRPSWRSSADDRACSAYVTGSGDTVWLSKGRALAEIDALTGLVLDTRVLPAASNAPGTACYGVRYTAGRLLASRSSDGAIGYLDSVSGAFAPIVTGFRGIDARERADHAAAWAVGFRSLWIDLNGTLVEVDLKTGKTVARIRVGAAGGGLTVDGASGVWVLDPSGHTLIRVDPATRRVSKRIALSHPAYSITSGYGRIWLALG
jgi:hypothetical protein